MIKSLNYWLLDSFVLTRISFAKYLRYLFRFLCDWRTNLKWVNFLNSNEQMQNLRLTHKGNLQLKIQYPYLTQNLNRAEVCDLLMFHYQWLFSCISLADYHAEHLLWNYYLEDGSDHLELHLKFRSDYMHEGEMCLLLKLNNQIQYTLTFTRFKYFDRSVFFIGGLQGGRREVASADGIKMLTKKLYGLRPKQLMLYSLSILSDFWQDDGIIAISNHNHIFNSKARRWRKKTIQSNLDEFWLEFDAKKMSKGDYLLTPLSRQIDLAQVPSKKRCQYKRRQIVLNDLEEQISTCLKKLLHQN